MIPQGSVISLNGSIGGVGGENASISLVINYNTGQLSGFVTGGLPWRDGYAIDVSFTDDSCCSFNRYNALNLLGLCHVCNDRRGQ
jgi:hypothetical protein